MIRLHDWRAARERRQRKPATVAAATHSRPARGELFFDLACPFAYICAERVERVFDVVVWTPASAWALGRGSLEGDVSAEARLRDAAERRAAQLRLPLVWPERWPAEVPAAMRVASFAAEHCRGAEFALAAGRLAFCGGFDLEDPEIIAEAAAAAGITLDDCLAAARDGARDGKIEAAGRRLLAAGAEALPALKVGRSLYWGEDRVNEAAAAARVRRSATG